MIKTKRLVNRFIKLVKVNSVSRDEKAVALLLKKELSALGYKSVSDNAGAYINGNCGNIFVNIKGALKKAPALFINAHIDTVIVNKSIKPVIRNGVIYSDGSTILGADCKAPVAAIIEAITVLKEKKIPHGDIQLCLTVAEEIGLLGARNMNNNLIKADFGIVIDGSDPNKIINRAPAQISFEAKIIGRAAHAGVHPEKGINAIKVAADAISKMKIGRIDYETTSNIGIIEGGNATNIVPEQVYIKGEARSHSRAKLKKQIRSVTNAIARACRKHRASFRFKVEPVYKSFKISEKSKLIQIVRSAVKNIGMKPQIIRTGGGSDANIFNALGLPCLILGVGFHNVHTSKEYVAIKDLEDGAKLILSTVKEVAKIGQQD